MHKTSGESLDALATCLDAVDILELEFMWAVLISFKSAMRKEHSNHLNLSIGPGRDKTGCRITKGLHKGA